MPLGHEVAHLSHLTLNTPVLDKSVDFFVDYLGMAVNGEDNGKVFLRTWDEYEHHTITLTQNDVAGIRRTHLRAASPEALGRLTKGLESGGFGIGWEDGEPGYGQTYLFKDPDGHEFGLYWDSEWFVAPKGSKPALKNQAQAYPGRGVGVRRLDHNQLSRQARRGQPRLPA